MSGFHQSGYATSTGSALHLEHSNGWVLKRGLASTDYFDLVSPYPMFAEENFSAIAQDLKALTTSGAVSLTLRTDALSESQVLETKAEWDWFRPFKTHHICNLEKSWRDGAARNAIRYERQARDTFSYSEISNPASYARELRQLNISVLARTRGHIRDALDIAILEQQLGLSGARLFAARDDIDVQALGFFMTIGNKAYAYLLGCSDTARASHAIYGLYGTALDALSHDIQYVDFGGAPGLQDAPDHSVVKFKQLWTNQTAKSYICGNVLNPKLYDNLVKKYPAMSLDFFPAYQFA